MAVTQYAPGKIKAIIYFVNERGTIMMLPTDEECFRFRDKMKMLGFEMMFAESLHEAQKLEKRMQEQLYAEQQKELEQDEDMTRRGRQAVKDRMQQRLMSANTSAYEKDFIRAWYKWREEKHAVFQRRFTQQIGNLDALNFDNPDKHIHDLLDRT